MAAAEPIRCKKQLKNLAEYWLHKNKNGGFAKPIYLRNYALIVLGVYTALRISDLLKLKWDDVYDKTHKIFRSHITIIEKKTRKHKKIALNPRVIVALQRYFWRKDSSAFLFTNYRKDGRAISRVQAWRIIKFAARAAKEINTTNTNATISPHSLRKTFGYFAWINGISPVIIMDIYNHSSYEVTRRYLGLTQDDRDKIYLRARMV